MKLEDAIARLLREAEIERVYSTRPSVLTCAEPVVVGPAVITQGERLTEGERLDGKLEIFVVRTVKDDALRVAYEVWRALMGAQWEAVARTLQGRIVALEVAAPAYDGQDESGRHVYKLIVDVELTWGR